MASSKKSFLVIFLFTLFLSGCSQNNLSDLKTIPQDNLVLPAETEENKQLDQVNPLSDAPETAPVLGKDMALGDLKNNPPSNGIKKYKLIAPKEYAPVYLELYPDLTFKMEFNNCERIAEGDGKYTMENGLYFLDVESSPTVASLSTVNVELKQISDTQLKVVSEVYRMENGQKAYFCTPMSDPDNKMEGEEYNIYELVN